MKRSLAQFKDKTFDALIIGGGINGCAVARDAARRGLKVALVEKGDFSSGTTASSTKLIHGGVRYLEHFEFRLVWESCHERRRLLDLAPHLVRPLSFLIPFYKGDRRSPLLINLGMWLYDLMAGFRNVGRHRMLSAEQALDREPRLNAKGLRGAALYYDAQVNDSRLCLENALDAAANGAVLANHLECVSLEKKGELWQAQLRDKLGRANFPVQARAILNLAGPWVDKTCAMLKSDIPAKVRTTKGVHAVTAPLTDRHALLLFSRSDSRIFFVIPWLSGSLVGTTDTDFKDSPDKVTADQADIDYLLAEARRVFPGVKLTTSQLTTTFAGLRPLVFDPDKNESAVSREHIISEDAPGFLTMAGGKLTTYRAMAEQLTDRLAKMLGRRTLRPCDTMRVPLYGGDLGGNLQDYLRDRALSLEQIIPPELARPLINHLGSRHQAVIDIIKHQGKRPARICSHHNHLMAEVDYAVNEEMALTLQDFMRYRTWICFAPCRGLDCAPGVAKRMSKLLGWTPQHVRQQLSDYRRWVKKSSSF
jgi:glycerol-3-phosphate dehydrogenase